MPGSLAEEYTDIERIANSDSVTLPGDMDLIFRVFNLVLGELIVRAHDATQEVRDGGR